MGERRIISKEYAAWMLIEILFEKGHINQATYINIRKKYKLSAS